MRQQFSRYSSRKARERRFGSSYHADAVHFDGDAAIRINSLTCVDETSLAISYWIKEADANDNHLLWVSDRAHAENCQLYYAIRKPRLQLFGPLGANEIENSAAYSADAWHHILISVDSAAGRHKFYVDDVDVTTVISSDADVVADFNGKDFSFGDDGFEFFITADVSEFWFAVGQSLTDGGGTIPQATRRKFISASGKPVDLGADGSTPTGTAPTIFFSGNSSGFATNKGTGGAFTLTGSLTNAATSPSD